MGQAPNQIKLIRCLVRFHHGWYTELLEDKSEEYIKLAIKDALEGKNAKLYRFFLDAFKYVGGSNLVNEKVWEEMNPKPTYHRIRNELGSAECPKLESFDQFDRCGYSKSQKDSGKPCTMPRFFNECPLPQYDMKNGKLNQMVFSTYLFLKDRCQGDFPGFIKEIFGTPQQVEKLEEEELNARVKTLENEMCRIFNVGPKLINMTMSSLFYAKTGKWNYRRVFPQMAAVDSLVHEFLHRTGTLKLFGREHKYGEKVCHSPEGCVGVINDIARQIDCRRYNKDYPEYYPRMVQVCIWKFCTESCNQKNCKYEELDEGCEFFDWCEHLSN